MVGLENQYMSRKIGFLCQKFLLVISFFIYLKSNVLDSFFLIYLFPFHKLSLTSNQNLQFFKLHIGFKKYLLECAYHNEYVQNEVHFDRDGVNSYVNVYK